MGLLDGVQMLDGKVAFITGGGSGIGKGTALRFAEQGAKVVLADRSTGPAEDVVKQITDAGGEGFVVPCDVSVPEQVEAAANAAVKKFGKLTTVFANAGINGVWAPITDLTPQEWDTTLNINLRGTFLTFKYTIPHLRSAGGGSMIVTSSVNGTRTFSTAGASAYSSSKAGQMAFVRMAALELAQDNIRVNGVCPGAIRTNIGDSTTQRNTESIRLDVKFPQGRPGLDGGQGDIHQVADTCLFLASDLSRHVSGDDIFVDGGFSLLK